MNTIAPRTAGNITSPMCDPMPRTARATRMTRCSGLLALNVLSGSVLLAFASAAYANGPTGGVVTYGTATIVGTGTGSTITQTTANVVINWDSFNIGAGQTVQFVQPGTSSVALNRVIGADPSSILGTLNSNGRVFLVNPNGILFGAGSSVNVGSLVATTLGISDADFVAGKYRFTGSSSGAVTNNGTITAANGGYVALMGRSVSNEGLISARLGTVALASGEAITLDLGGDGLLNVAVSRGAINSLASNGGVIQADGGRVLLSAQGAGGLLDSVVNSTGIIQAHTLENRGGTILLLGDKHTGTVNVSGLLDASAPNGGNGGFIETSAAHVNVGNAVRVTTAAPRGTTGRWLIDPRDFVIGSAPGNNIAGSTLSAQLVTNNVTISTVGAGTENGDIFVNDAVSWTASGTPTTLTLNADRNIDINAPITATNGNLAACCGQDINVNAAITTTNGSVLLSAGRDINQKAAITVTDGNLTECAANNITIAGAITVTRGTLDPTRSLGLPRGLTLSADTDGSGPGIAGGTVLFDPLAPPVTVTAAPVNIYYNPASYTAPTDYRTKFTLTEGAALTQYMLVFADGGTKTYDGTTTAALSGLKGNPVGVTLVAGPGSRANFESPDIGASKRIAFAGYTLTGPNAGAYALPFNCCGAVLAHTTGDILVAAPPPVTPPPTTPPPVTPPPPTTPPPVTPPPVTPPPVTPPPVTPPTTPPPTGLPPPGTTILGLPPPRIVSRPPPGTLVVVPPVTPPTLAFVTPPPPRKPPYVAPVRVPKPYRN